MRKSQKICLSDLRTQRHVRLQAAALSAIILSNIQKDRSRIMSELSVLAKEIKKWVVSDYFTPNIKAEVILD